MEINAKKRWLWRYRDTLREVESLERLEAERRLNATGMAGRRIDGSPGPPVRANKAGGPEVSHMEVLADLDDARKRADSARRDILAAAAKLDGTEANVIRCRYINGLNWSEIRDVTGFSLSWLQRIHKSAIANIDCGD